MLTKLIGYEMKAFGRIILPLYAATLGMSFLIGLGVRFLPEEAYNKFFGATVSMIFSVLIISTMVMTGILCVQRFYQNLLGNEGYLMFSFRRDSPADPVQDPGIPDLDIFGKRDSTLHRPDPGCDGCSLPGPHRGSQNTWNKTVGAGCADDG